MLGLLKLRWHLRGLLCIIFHQLITNLLLQIYSYSSTFEANEAASSLIVICVTQFH